MVLKLAALNPITIVTFDLGDYVLLPSLGSLLMKVLRVSISLY